MSEEKEYSVDVLIEGTAFASVKAKSLQEALVLAEELEGGNVDSLDGLDCVQLRISSVISVEDLETADVIYADGRRYKPKNFEKAVEAYQLLCTWNEIEAKEPIEAVSYRRGSQWVLCNNSGEVARVNDSGYVVPSEWMKRH